MKFQISNFKFQILKDRKINFFGNCKLEIINWKCNRGFTLIELLLGIAILAILGTTVFFMLNPFEQIRKTNDTKRKSDLAQMQRALELYYQDFGRYPQSSGDYKIYINSATITWGNSWQPYIAALPKDPSPTASYVYYSPPSSNGQSYYIYASLQRGSKDTQSCNAGNACASMSQSGFPVSNSCGGVCNYGVSSPNVSP
jgi:general secretion pathway protein G